MRVPRIKLRVLSLVPLALVGVVGLSLLVARPSQRAIIQQTDQPTVAGMSTSAAETATPTPATTPSLTAIPTPAPPTPPVAKKPAATPRPAVRTAPTAPVTEIASEAVCAGQSNVAAASSVLPCLTAYARTFHGLSRVGADAALMAAAAAKIGDMATCGYSHTACGRTANYWTGQKGYAGRCTAENIAYGQQSPRAVFEAWMKSPGHRANILGPNYRHIGVATGTSSSGRLWVMELGGC